MNPSEDLTNSGYLGNGRLWSDKQCIQNDIHITMTLTGAMLPTQQTNYISLLVNKAMFTDVHNPTVYEVSTLI